MNFLFEFQLWFSSLSEISPRHALLFFFFCFPFHCLLSSIPLSLPPSSFLLLFFIFLPPPLLLGSSFSSSTSSSSSSFSYLRRKRVCGWWSRESQSQSSCLGHYCNVSKSAITNDDVIIVFFSFFIPEVEIDAHSALGRVAFVLLTKIKKKKNSKKKN